jgi:predicted permease
MLGLPGDLRAAIRNHRRTPIATTVTVLSLGLGIGSVAVVVALFQTFVFPPPTGYAAPERLATLYTSRPAGDLYGLSSYGDFLDLRAGLEALDDLAATSLQFHGLAGEPAAPVPAVEPLITEGVSGNYFRVAGISPLLGRGILESDVSVERPRDGAEQVVVLGHDLWRHRFAADPAVVGRTVRLDAAAYTVVGVAPDGIVSRRAPLEVDAWIPLGVDGRVNPGRYDERAQRSLLLLGRLSPGSTLDDVQAQADVLASRLAGEHPEAWSDRSGHPRRLTVVSERGSRVNPRARRLLLAIGLFLLGAAALILLLACSNAASLFLSRAAVRAREMAIRRSLGSSDSRLVRLWLMDGLLPGLAAGGVGLLAVQLTRQALASFSLPINIPVDVDLDLEPSLFLIVFTLAVGASVLFALVPALAGSRTPLVAALRRGTFVRHRRTLFGRSSSRDLPVLLQCAAAVVLLIGATLFVRSTRSSGIDLGLDPERIAIATTFLSGRQEPVEERSEAALQRADELVEALRARPGVERAAIARRVELTIVGIDSRVEVIAVDGAALSEEERPTANRNSVSPGYLEMLDVPLLAGRGIVAHDRRGSPLVAVVNETLARRLWPDGDAVGRRMTIRQPPWEWEADTTPRKLEVVGVARDGKYLDFDDSAMPYLWLPLAQDPSREVVVLAKGMAGATQMLPLLRELVTVAPGQTQQIPPSTLEEQVSLQFLHLRIASRILAWGGVFGLLLAALGIYGIVALAVQQRRRELAIRVAVGARRVEVLRTVLGDTARLVGMGLLLGVGLVVPLAGMAKSILVRVSVLDPLSLLPAVALLLSVGVVASIGPARHALRGSPVDSLREE